MENIMNNEIISYKNKINELHQEIETAYKTAVQKAWSIGEMLILVRSTIPKGTFENWIIENCNFKRAMAYRYIKIKENVMSTAVDEYNSINDCIEQIDNREKEQRLIEQKKNQAENKTRFNCFNERYKTGRVPKNWNSNWNVHYAEWELEERERDERIRKIQEEKNINETKRKQEDYEFQETFDKLQDYLASEQQKINERQKYNSKIKDMNMLYDVIDDYVRSLNNSQKLECYNNLIKYCKNKAISLNINS